MKKSKTNIEDYILPQELLLLQLMEECAEVIQRASKASRFGINEIQEGQSLNNSERLTGELADLIGVYQLLVGHRYIKPPTEDQIQAKKEKVFKYYKVSQGRGKFVNTEYNPCSEIPLDLDSSPFID